MQSLDPSKLHERQGVCDCVSLLSGSVLVAAPAGGWGSGTSCLEVLVLQLWLGFRGPCFHDCQRVRSSLAMVEAIGLWFAARQVLQEHR